MKKFLIYLILLGALVLFPSTNVDSTLGSTPKLNEGLKTELVTSQTNYPNKMHVNSVSWNAHWNGSAHFKAATSNTTWNGGYYWNTLYVYGESVKGNSGVATYITNFKIHAVTPYGDNVIYQDRYLLIGYGETRAVASLYSAQPNTAYFITWDSCTPF